jgi:hypothetical protein
VYTFVYLIQNVIKNVMNFEDSLSSLFVIDVNSIGATTDHVVPSSYCALYSKTKPGKS